jgi:hypothetical protein
MLTTKIVVAVIAALLAVGIGVLILRLRGISLWPPK